MIEGVLTDILIPGAMAEYHPKEAVRFVEDYHDLKHLDDFSLMYDPKAKRILFQTFYEQTSPIVRNRTDVVAAFMTPEAYTLYKLGRETVEEQFDLKMPKEYDSFFMENSHDSLR